MKKAVFIPFVVLMLLAILAPQEYAHADDFQLVVAQTPPGNNTNTSNWREVYRYEIAGTGGTATQLSGLPVGEVFDPVSVEFRSPTELFVGNRHGNTLGEGSISRFEIDSSGNYNYLGNFSSSGMTSGVHEMSFSPTTGELFATTIGNGIFRFTFPGGNPSPNGSFSSGAWDGIQVSPTGNYIYATNFAQTVYQFEIKPDDTIDLINSFTPPGVGRLHFFGTRLDQELFLGDDNGSQVHRYEILGDGNLQYKSTMNVINAVDIAFSPDNQEMFVSSYHDGIYRFLYEENTDSWTQTGLIEMEWAAGIAITPVPEPATLSLLAIGALFSRKRNR